LQRAYIAGFGTTGVVVVSAVLLLAVVSTLVAFRGWPEAQGPLRSTGKLVIRAGEPSPHAEGLAKAPRRAAPAGADRAESAPGARTTTRRATPARATQPPTLPTLASPPAVPRDLDLADTGEGAGSSEGVSPPGPGPSSPPPRPPERSGLGSVTEGIGYTTQGLTNSLGQTVGTLDPQLGGTVQGAGSALSELLHALGSR
jgi:hypothetical protein